MKSLHRIGHAFHRSRTGRAVLRTLAEQLKHRPVRWIAQRARFFGYQGTPRAVMLSVTGRCQCTCAHCGVSDNAACGELSFEKIVSTIDEIAAMGAYVVYLFGGEPLLRDDIGQIIRHARSRGLEVHLDTNGWLLDARMARELHDAGLDLIRVSLDSPDAALHDANRGKTGCFARAVAGARACSELGLRTEISTCVTRLMLHNGEVSRMVVLAGSLNAALRLLKPVPVGNLDGRNDQLLSDADVQLLRTHLRRDKVYLENELVSTPDAPHVCLAMMGSLVYVSPKGDVQPCCYLPLSFGNIHIESLAAIVKRMHADPIYSEFGVFRCPMSDAAFRRERLEHTQVTERLAA